MTPPNRTAVILIVLGLVLLAAIAYLLWGNKDQGSAVSTSEVAVSEIELRFLSLTTRIDPVEFDTSILTDPRFLGLEDLRTAIVPEAKGRIDPFAQLQGISTK